MILYLLPGLLCDQTVWRHQIENLSALAEIRIANFRGFDSLTAMAQSILDETQEPFCVAGHSMGGRVALELVNLAPQQVQKLALLDTGVHARKQGEAEKRQVLLDLARDQGLTELARAWAWPMVHPDRRQGELMEEIYAMVGRYTLEEYQGQIRALLNRPDATPYLPEIQCETLVLCGREDDWSPWQQHREFSAMIPHASFRIIEHCGHMATMEQAQIVTEELRQWLLR